MSSSACLLVRSLCSAGVFYMPAFSLNRFWLYGLAQVMHVLRERRPLVHFARLLLAVLLGGGQEHAVALATHPRVLELMYLVSLRLSTPRCPCVRPRWIDHGALIKKRMMSYWRGTHSEGGMMHDAARELGQQRLGGIIYVAAAAGVLAAAAFPGVTTFILVRR